MKTGYKATTHQTFVGTGYFDKMAMVISQNASGGTNALVGSTEESQFH